MTSVDLFSCIGCHALGFARAGIDTIALCESHPFRRQRLREHFSTVPVYDDVRTYDPVHCADIVIGGPPCQRTSVASAIHGRRSGESLWREQLRIARRVAAQWVVVEQPPGNASWEDEVGDGLERAGLEVARFEFGAHDVGAPYLRRRGFLVACASLQRLALARAALPSAIDTVKRAAVSRGDWNPDQLGILRVDARSAGEMERSASALRRQRIEALGDSNPPHMAEVIGRAIVQAMREGV